MFMNEIIQKPAVVNAVESINEILKEPHQIITTRFDISLSSNTNPP